MYFHAGAWERERKCNFFPGILNIAAIYKTSTLNQKQLCSFMAKWFISNRIEKNQGCACDLSQKEDVPVHEIFSPDLRNVKKTTWFGLFCCRFMGVSSIRKQLMVLFSGRVGN